MNLNTCDKKWVEDFWAKFEKKHEKSAVTQFTNIPYTTDENGKYDTTSPERLHWWTNGFFGGMMWLMYKETGKEVYRKTAENHEKMLDEVILHDFDNLDHDVGFIWHLTAKADFDLTENKESRNRALLAAATLSARYNLRGNFIRAWNHDPSLTIIDTMMNLPLLYWASQQKEDERFSYVAQAQADMTMRYHIRYDGSVAHIVQHCLDKDEKIQDFGGQGYAQGSAWTRGCSWAVYGFMLSYLYTKEAKYLEIAKRTADFFADEVAKNNYKTPTDFNQPAEPAYIDNTAGVIASCGMIEIYKETKDEKYLNCAINILKALEEDCIFDDSCESILQNGMESYKIGKEMHIVYGDFFLCEAILKLKGSDYLIW